jgi:hypothetical protein
MGTPAMGRQHRDESRRGGDAARWGSFTRFSETLLTGVLVACGSVLVVTAIPALAAGTAHLRRHLDGEADSIATFVTDFRRAWRALWPLGIAAPLLVVLLAINASSVATGAAPGGAPVVVVTAAIATAAVVVAARAAVLWRPRPTDVHAASDGSARRTILRNRAIVIDAGRRAVDDPVGSAWIVTAVAMGALLAWMLPPLAIVAPGLVALALVAVERRPGASPPDRGR